MIILEIYLKLITNLLYIDQNHSQEEDQIINQTYNIKFISLVSKKKFRESYPYLIWISFNIHTHMSPPSLRTLINYINEI